jgi:hypothetical protein
MRSLRSFLRNLGELAAVGCNWFVARKTFVRSSDDSNMWQKQKL